MKCFALAAILVLGIAANASAQVPNQRPLAPPEPRRRALAPVAPATNHLRKLAPHNAGVGTGKKGAKRKGGKKKNGSK
jgi:hypothetical protein